MSVMGCIIEKVFEEENLKGGSRSIAKGPLTFTPEVDIDNILDRIAARRRERLNWRTSIVDLLKLLNLDSSFPARKELAQELGYSNCADDSAAMNSWLHRQVMKRLAESSTKVLSTYLH